MRACVNDISAETQNDVPCTRDAGPPVFNRHTPNVAQDAVQIFLKHYGDGLCSYVLSIAVTLSGTEQHICKFYEKGSGRNTIKAVIFGFKQNNESLKDFEIKMHNIIQPMLAEEAIFVVFFSILLCCVL